MLVGRVVDDQLGDDLQAPPVRFLDELAEVLERAVVGMDVGVIGDVVAVVAQWRRIEGQQPDGVDAQLLDVVELLRQAGEIADAIAVGVLERLDVHLVDDRVLVPKRVVAHVLALVRGSRVDGFKRTGPVVGFPRTASEPGHKSRRPLYRLGRGLSQEHPPPADAGRWGELRPNQARRELRKARMSSKLDRFLSPGIQVMQVARLSLKFAIISAAFMVPLCVAVYGVVSYSKSNIEFARQEAAGHGVPPVHEQVHGRPLRPARRWRQQRGHAPARIRSTRRAVVNKSQDNALAIDQELRRLQSSLATARRSKIPPRRRSPCTD